MNRKSRRRVSALLPLLVAVFTAWPAGAQKVPEIPSGTTVQVRMIDKLSSEENQTGDTFHGTLEEPIEVNGKQVFPKGADVLGRVTDVHRTGRLSEPGELDLVLVTISSGTMAESIHVQPLVIKGVSHTKSNVTKIGGGAALGAVIGAIAGGGKGAAIGTIAGAAAGTGAAAATGKRPATVESEAVLSFTTSAPGVVTAVPHEAGETATLSPRTGAAAANASPSAATSAASDAANDDTRSFSLRDRRILRTCVNEHLSDFAPGSTQRAELPSGSERQIRRGEILPSEVQKQAQPLPLACEEQLPRLPGDVERVVYNGRVLLLDSGGRILDLFYLDDAQ